MAGSITKNWATDKSKEQDGVWVDIAINDDETTGRIKVLRAGQSNRDFIKLFSKLGKKFSMMRGDKAKLEKKAYTEAFCKTCIVGWENIENINAVPIIAGQPPAPKEPYMGFTAENAIKLFTAVPDLFDYVIEQATDLSNFQSDNEEAAKN